MVIYVTDSTHGWDCVFLVTPAQWQGKFFREAVWDKALELLDKKPTVKPYTITILEEN